MSGKKSPQETRPKLPEESSANMGMSLSNNVYMDDNELAKSQQTHPSSWPNRFLSRDNANDDPVYVNDQQPEHDYLNWNGQDHDNEETALVDPRNRQGWYRKIVLIKHGCYLRQCPDTFALVARKL